MSAERDHPLALFQSPFQILLALNSNAGTYRVRGGIEGAGSLIKSPDKIPPAHTSQSLSPLHRYELVADRRGDILFHRFSVSRYTNDSLTVGRRSRHKEQ